MVDLSRTEREKIRRLVKLGMPLDAAVAYVRWCRLAWVLLTRHLARAQRFDYFEERKWAPMDHDWRYPSSYLKRKP